MVRPYSKCVALQVGRQQDPAQDAAMVVAVRQAVGPNIVLRADANRKWSLNQAVAFGHVVLGADLQVCTIAGGVDNHAAIPPII